jgi:hypothetical protein
MNEIIKYSVSFLIYLIFQVFLFNYFTLFHAATPFLFLMFLFMLPLNVPLPAMYLLAFLTGLSVDVLSDGYANGLHAFSALLAVSARIPVARLVASSNIRNASEISLKEQSMVWYATFLFPLIVIHHTAYFMLEAFSFQHFSFTLLKIVSSSIYTFLLCYAICFIFYRK